MKVLKTIFLPLGPRRMALYAVAAVLLMLTGSCQDDRLWDDNYCPSGMPATVTVPLTLGDVREVTRGDLGAGLDKTVTSMWIGVYNVASGERTGFRECTPEELGVFEDFHTDKTVTLEATSGPSYIVAVANYEFRPATDGSGKLGSLADRLNEADTWEKFQSIAAAFDDVCGINQEAPLNALLMSGAYTSKKHTDGSMTDIEPIAIQPGTNSLDGKIHLRRMISQVKFNVSFNTDNVVSAQVTSWKVHNLPVAAWLMERADNDATPNCTDAFAVTARNSDDNARFRDGNLMTDITNKSTSDQIAYAFDFWQLENKKTGNPPKDGEYTKENAYKWREREYKNDGSNSGKYMSLVESSTSESLNNMATFVEFSVSMEMKVDEKGNELPDNHRRLVETTYVVHLGYCEGADNMEKATDFNCRRNTIYTYNVTVKNVNDLLVEARKEGEVAPGAEGLITDISNDYYELDAHYGAFNIYLTETELKGFKYNIVAYDENGAEVIIDPDPEHPETVPKPGDKKFKYLSWVELRYSNDKDPNLLAAYKPRTGTHSDDKTYTLQDIAEKKGNDLKAGYYTVFVNEYVYETSTDGNEKGSTATPAWWGYVNRPPRRAWIYVSGNVSTDGETIHYTSKYALSQHSIQTYYRVGPGSAMSGLGVEHDNETEGLNLRNTFNYTDGHLGLNAKSGRYNLAQYLTNSTDESITLSDIKWESYVQTNTVQKINEIINKQNVNRSARIEPLPALILNSDGTDGRGDIDKMKVYDADQTDNPQYVEAIRACLNRNRDINGDGLIDNSEIRWFVPTKAQMLRLVLGRRSLETPILNVDGVTRLPNERGDKNGWNSSMLFATSDGRMMWLMEGVSDSWWREWSWECAAPWQIRCVRNLGSDMRTMSTSNTTEAAFQGITKQVNGKTEYYVDLSRYEARSIREEAYRNSDNPMPIHHLYDQRYNRCYRAFEMYDSVIPLNDSRLGLQGKTIKISDYLSKTNPCAVLVKQTGKQGWRVANQKELNIMAAIGWYNHNAAGTTLQVSCTFSYFDTGGYAIGSNPNAAANSVSSDYRYVMQVNSRDGRGTQADRMNNSTINNNYFGVRCVRDVDSY